jgi:hypothetical protein
MFLRNKVCSLLGLEEYAIAGRILSRLGELANLHGKTLGHRGLHDSSICLLRSSEVTEHLIAVIKENIPYDVLNSAIDEEKTVIIEKIALALLKAAIVFDYGITAIKIYDLTWYPVDVDSDKHGEEPMDNMVFKDDYHYESELPVSLFQQKSNLEKVLKPLLMEMQFSEPLFIKHKITAVKQTISAISRDQSLQFVKLPREVFQDTMRLFLLASVTPPAVSQDNKADSDTITYQASARVRRK